MQQMNRIDPAMPVTAYKTYQIAAPLSTHWRSASCEEVSCSHFLAGWRTDVDEATDLGKRQADYIRHDRSRSCTEERLPTGLTAFTFGPGQKCFHADDHRVRREVEEIFIERGGDWRGNPTGDRRVHVRPAEWVESFGLHQQKLADRMEQG